MTHPFFFVTVPRYGGEGCSRCPFLQISSANADCLLFQQPINAFSGEGTGNSPRCPHPLEVCKQAQADSDRLMERIARLEAELVADNLAHLPHPNEVREDTQSLFGQQEADQLARTLVIASRNSGNRWLSRFSAVDMHNAAPDPSRRVVWDDAELWLATLAERGFLILHRDAEPGADARYSIAPAFVRRLALRL